MFSDEFTTTHKSELHSGVETSEPLVTITRPDTRHSSKLEEISASRIESPMHALNETVLSNQGSRRQKSVNLE